MSGFSRFDFYPRDWFLDTRDLSDRAKGCYIDLLAATYNRGGPLPYDEKYLCKIAGYKQVRSLRHVLDELLCTGKFKIVDGELVNNRAQEELATAQRRKEIASAGGQAKAEKVKTGRKPSEKSSKSSRKVGEPKAGNEPKQEVSACSPSPSPSPTTSKNDDYAFDGTVIRLNWRDYSRWADAYRAIPDIRALLQSRDDWLATRPEGEQRNWFVSTSNYLAKQNAGALAEQIGGQDDEYDADFIN